MRNGDSLPAGRKLPAQQMLAQGNQRGLVGGRLFPGARRFTRTGQLADQPDGSPRARTWHGLYREVEAAFGFQNERERLFVEGADNHTTACRLFLTRQLTVEAGQGRHAVTCDCKKVRVGIADRDAGLSAVRQRDNRGRKRSGCGDRLTGSEHQQRQQRTATIFVHR